MSIQTHEQGVERVASVPSAGALPWREHALVDVVEGGRWRKLSDAEVKAALAAGTPEEVVVEYWRSREERIAAAERDPLRHGFELPFMEDFRGLLARKEEVYGLGANGSGKTDVGGKLVCEALVSERKRKVLCVAQNGTASIVNQQAAVYRYLPVLARGRNEAGGPKRRHAVQKLNYSQSGGFTEGTFVLPNGSQCWFKTVEQFVRDKVSFEGPEYHLVWIDEPAVLALVETLRYRVGKAGGKFLFTFTAVDGFDAVCGQVLTGARVVKSLPMDFDWYVKSVGSGESGPSVGSVEGGRNPGIIIPELRLDEVQVKGLPAGHMPYLMQPLDPKIGIIFTWTQWNGFLPRSKENPAVPAIFEKCRGKPRGQVRTRLFGWVERIAGAAVPNFRPEYFPKGHLVKHEAVEGLLRRGELSLYMGDDCATARSHFIVWKGVAAPGVDDRSLEYIVAESPAFENGEWGTGDGERGDGQRIYAEMGVDWYKRHIREVERGLRAGGSVGSGPSVLSVESVGSVEDVVVRRKGDPRGFATASAAAEGATSFFELFWRDDGERDPELRPMIFEPAAVKRTVRLDLGKITDLLACDWDREVDGLNRPHLLISDRCRNLILCLLNWDGSEDSAWKDGVDALRYVCDEGTPWVEGGMPAVRGGKGW